MFLIITRFIAFLTYLTPILSTRSNLWHMIRNIRIRLIWRLIFLIFYPSNITQEFPKFFLIIPPIIWLLVNSLSIIGTNICQKQLSTQSIILLKDWIWANGILFFFFFLIKTNHWKYWLRLLWLISSYASFWLIYWFGITH